MPGIAFFGTRNIEEIKGFYIERLNLTIWLEQKDCIILRHGNLLIGFCKRDYVDKDGIITLFYRDVEEVNRMYGRLKDVAENKPVKNDKYKIYHFFAKDPEGRKLEFLTFLHETEPYLIGDELLVSRRSIRSFKDKEVPNDILWKIFEVCRYSPTSKNSQSYYFIVIRNKEIIKKLASLRGSSSAPLGRAPMAVAIISDPDKSKRYVQDGCIAAYHFMLAAWTYGLGTCWIAAMDREEVKEMLGVPKHHYVATITPLGYPEYVPKPPPRREAKEMVKFI